MASLRDPLDINQRVRPIQLHSLVRYKISKHLHTYPKGSEQKIYSTSTVPLLFTPLDTQKS